MRPLILIGGGGHCKSVIEAAESSGWTIMGILDLPEFLGKECLGYKVIGVDDDIPHYVEECDFVVTLGFIKNPIPRIKLHQLVEKNGGKFATIIASTAHVSKDAKIADGTVVLHHSTVNAGAKIGKGCIINTAANIEHDVEICDYTHISTGAMVNGDCTIGKGCFIGSGAVINNGIRITDNCIFGSGSVVHRDISDVGIYVGNPIRKIG